MACEHALCNLQHCDLCDGKRCQFCIRDVKYQQAPEAYTTSNPACLMPKGLCIRNFHEYASMQVMTGAGRHIPGILMYGIPGAPQSWA